MVDLGAVELVADGAEEAVAVRLDPDDVPVDVCVVTHDLVIARPDAVAAHDLTQQFAHVVLDAWHERAG